MENPSGSFPRRRSRFISSRRCHYFHDANEFHIPEIFGRRTTQRRTILSKFGVETLPTGYLVCAPGGRVGEVGEAELIQPQDAELVHSYALTASMYGFKALYLEAGSGADKQVEPSLIQSAAKCEDLVLLVGGGIRTPEQASIAARAGANWIVTGTLTEDANDSEDLRNKLTAVINALNP